MFSLRGKIFLCSLPRPKIEPLEMNFTWSHRGREENINFFESIGAWASTGFPVPLARDLCVKRFGKPKSIFTLMIYRTTGNIHKNIPKCGQWSDEHDPLMHAKRLQLSDNVTDEGKLITGCYQWPDGNLTFLRENILAATVIVLNLIIPFQGVHGQSFDRVTSWLMASRLFKKKFWAVMPFCHDYISYGRNFFK